MMISSQSVIAQTITQQPHGVISGGSGSEGVDYSDYWILLAVVVVLIIIAVAFIRYSKKKNVLPVRSG